MTKEPIIKLREYQRPIFNDRSTGILILHWSRQIGKSYTLAAWAVDRLLTRPGRLVTVLSNSRDNGAEFALKCAEVARMLNIAKENVGFEATDESVDFLEMKFEVKIKVKGVVGRIKVLAASPRTARGFSGDLILDEFAFHEDGAAIWDAAEPILSSNPDFLCRIASTGNGTNNMFYRMATEGIYQVSRVRRSDAYKMGVKIYDAKTRKSITPEEAREQALDKASYDQNYECAFASESGSLLTNNLINDAVAESDGEIYDGGLPEEALVKIEQAGVFNRVFVGWDIAASHDFSVMSAFEEIGETMHGLWILRLKGTRLPQQEEVARRVLSKKEVKRLALDETGMGLALAQRLEDEFGDRVEGVNFATSVEIGESFDRDGSRRGHKARITEVMATELLEAHEDHRINYPCDGIMREDLRKPRKITSRTGRVSIAAESSNTGHADHFWSLALAQRARGNQITAACEPPEDEVPQGYKYRRGW